MLYGCRANQCIAATTKATAAIHAIDPTRNARRLFLRNQSVEGTISSAPSHAICRAVPPAAFTSAARLIQAMAEFWLLASRARKHM